MRVEPGFYIAGDVDHLTHPMQDKENPENPSVAAWREKRGELPRRTLFFSLDALVAA